MRSGYDFQTRAARPSGRRNAQLVLGLIAVSAFGSAWLLRDGASASASPASAQAEAIVEAAGRTLAAPADNGAASIAKPADLVFGAQTPAKPLAIAAADDKVIPVLAPPAQEKAANEAAAVEAPTVAETPDENVVKAITGQIEKKSDEAQLKLPSGLKLKSSVVLVVDQDTREVLAAQNPDTVQPIASLTKLMTALVTTDAQLPLDEVIEITSDDIDREKHTYSRLRPGLTFTRRDLLLLALMSSENRAASALGRSYPGGRTAFIRAMNARARALGMLHTYYRDSSGLSSDNVSTAADLVRLVNAAYKVPLIRDFSTHVEHTVTFGRRSMHFISSNRLVRAENDWHIGLQKTGFTNEAGRCLVMQATVKGRDLVMVLLDSDGKLTRFADAQRVRSWIEGGSTSKAAAGMAKSTRRRAVRADVQAKRT